MSTLTKRQKEIYDYIKHFIKDYEYSPTFEDIKNNFKLSALSTVHEHIGTLIEKGYLSRNALKKNKLIELNKITNNSIDIPLVGVIAAGQPIEAIEIPNEVVSISKNEYFKNGELYALKVKGNSMIGDGIFDNDFVIVKKQNTAENGDTVVAIVDENEATLKRFYKEKGRIRLQPANPTLSPIYRKEVEIRGVVVKIIRNLK